MRTLSSAVLAAFLSSIVFWLGLALQNNLSSDVVNSASLFYTVLFGTFAGFFPALVMALILIATIQRSGRRPGPTGLWLAFGGTLGIVQLFDPNEGFQLSWLVPVTVAGVFGAAIILARLGRN
jgi:hypothetical protein